MKNKVRLVVTCVPLVCLLALASLMRVIAPTQGALSKPIVLPGESALSDDSLRAELKAALHRYRLAARTKNDGVLKQMTFAPSWESWQGTVNGKYVEQRLARLTRWESFTLGTPRRRESGHVEVFLRHNDETLKAWLVPSSNGWKVAGLVAPPCYNEP